MDQDVVQTIDISITAPELPPRLVRRPHLIETIEQIFMVSRLKRSWDEEYRSWCRRSLADDWVYVWADGIHSGLRGAGERLCVLVVIVRNRCDLRRGSKRTREDDTATRVRVVRDRTFVFVFPWECKQGFSRSGVCSS